MAAVVDGEVGSGVLTVVRWGRFLGAAVVLTADITVETVDLTVFLTPVCGFDVVCVAMTAFSDSDGSAAFADEVSVVSEVKTVDTVVFSFV